MIGATAQPKKSTKTAARRQPEDFFGVALRFGDGLSEAERRELDELVREPYEFMSDARFEALDAEATLFDPDVVIERPSTQWYDHLGLGTSRLSSDAKVDKLPLLRNDQQELAFLRFNYCRYRAEQARRSMALPRVARTKAREMLKWHRQAQHWRELLAEYNLGLVLAMARKLPKDQIDHSELIAEGNLALLRSIDKFRCDRGFRFSTYACRSILQLFGRTLQKQAKYRTRFPVHHDPDFERSDWADQKAQSQEADCVDELKRIIASNRASLSDTEIEVVRRRFNFEEPDRKRPATLEAVGRQIGVTKERVRQIQKHALNKLKQTLEDEFIDGRPKAAVAT